MGWDGYHNRQKYVAEQKSKSWPCNGNTVSVRKHHAEGDEDWFILDIKDPSGALVEAVITASAKTETSVTTAIRGLEAKALPLHYGDEEESR
jgi:hypothetical protein